MTTLADVYRVLEPEEMVLAGDQFNLSTLDDGCWGPIEAFAGRRVREVHERGKIKFRRLVVHEVVSQ